MTHRLRKAAGKRAGMAPVLNDALRQRISAERRNGRTLRAIADTLNSEQVPTAQGGRWKVASIDGASRLSVRCPRRRVGRLIEAAAQHEARLVLQKTKDTLGVLKPPGVRLGRPIELEGTTGHFIVAHHAAGSTLQGIFPGGSRLSGPSDVQRRPLVAVHGNETFCWVLESWTRSRRDGDTGRWAFARYPSHPTIPDPELGTQQPNDNMQRIGSSGGAG